MTNHILVKILGPIWFNIAGCLFLGWSWSTSGMGFPSSAGTTISSRVSMSLCRWDTMFMITMIVVVTFLCWQFYPQSWPLIQNTQLGMFLGCVDNNNSLGFIVSIQTSPSFATGGRGGLEIGNLFDGELFPSPPPQRGLPQIYGWDIWAIYMIYEICEMYWCWLFCWCEVVAKDNNDKIMLQALLLELKIAFARWLPMVPSSKLMGE